MYRERNYFHYIWEEYDPPQIYLLSTTPKKIYATHYQIAVAIMIKGGLVYERLNGQCAILNRVLQRLSIQL